MIKRLVFTIGLLTSSFLLAEAQSGSLTHDGESRTYIYNLPPGHDASGSYPLVLNLHGFGSNNLQQRFYSEMNTESDANGFIVVYPLGLAPNGLDNAWNSGWGTGVDDIGFLDKLIDEFINNFGANPDRVYSTGMSNGGFMSYTLACELEDKIAAIASVTGSMSVTTFNTCNPTRAMPVMQIHGTNDLTVPYIGNSTMTHVDTIMAYWAGNNNSPTTPTVEAVPNTVLEDSTTSEIYTYGYGDDSTQVILYKVTDGGHTWPGAFDLLGIRTSQDFRASAVIWEFFDEYDINGKRDKTVTSIRNERPEVQVNAYPNPFQESLTLTNVSAQATISIVDINGKVLIQEDVVSGSIHLNTAELATGTYFLTIDSKEGSSIQKVAKAY